MLSLVRIFLFALLLLTAIVVPGHRAHAQSLEPRSYANPPFGSTGVYSRTDSNFWTVGIAWQYRWGGGL